MQLNVIQFVAKADYAYLTVAFPPTPTLRERHLNLYVPGLRPEALQCLSEHWLASRQVEPRDGAAAGSVAEHLPDERLGNASLEQSGGHRAAQVVGAQAPVAGAPLPSADQRGDVAGAALHDAIVDIRNRLAAVETTLREALQNRSQVVADRHPTQAALAADVQQPGARVDVLQAQARQLRATNAELRERLENIRGALRDGAPARRHWRQVERSGWTNHVANGLAHTIDEVSRLLPAQDVELGRRDLGRDDAGERIAPAPAVRPSDAEQPTEEP